MKDSVTRKRTRIESVVLVGLFLVVLSLPAVGLVFKWRTSTEQEEFRPLARFPRFNRNSASFAAFPEDFTAYFNDNYGFRRSLISFQALGKMKVLGVSSSPHVMAGRDGWFYIVNEYSATGRHLVPAYTEQQLRDWRTLFEGRRDWLAQRGIRYVFTVLPRKETVYSEFLPESFQQRDPSRFDQLLEYMKRNSDVQIVDSRPGLFQAKAVNQIYLKTDTHWNYYGGLSGYQSVMRATGLAPEDEIVKIDECEISSRRVTGDLVRLLGLVGYMSEEMPVLTVRSRKFRTLEGMVPVIESPRSISLTENENEKLPRLVVFGDSSVGGLLPFLPRNFSRTVMLNQTIPTIDPALIESERPNIVIQVMGEFSLAAATQPNLSELETLKNWRTQKAVIHVSEQSLRRKN
jgi:alginate O-acetyltransferase complex protein AlgJ